MWRLAAALAVLLHVPAAQCGYLQVSHPLAMNPRGLGCTWCTPGAPHIATRCPPLIPPQWSLEGKAATAGAAAAAASNYPPVVLAGGDAGGGGAADLVVAFTNRTGDGWVLSGLEATTGAARALEQ